MFKTQHTTRTSTFRRAQDGFFSYYNYCRAIQAICLRQVVSGSWFIKNVNLHNDLNIPTLTQLTKFRYLAFHSKLIHCQNPLINRLSSCTIP